MSSSETVYMYSGTGQIRKWVTRNGEQLPPFWRWTSQMQKGERWRQVLGSDWDRQCQYELVLKMYVGGYRSRHRCARAHTHTRALTLSWRRSRRSETPGTAVHRRPRLSLVSFSVSCSLAGTELFGEVTDSRTGAEKAQGEPVPERKRSAGRMTGRVEKTRKPVRRDAHWPNRKRWAPPYTTMAMDHNSQQQS